MNSLKTFFKSSFYKNRFVISYILAGIVLVNIAYLLIYFAPAGLTSSEIQEISKLQNFSFSNLINFPYFLMQKTIFNIFGLTLLTAKILPMTFGLLSLILFYLSFIKYVKKKVALASLTIFTFSSNLLLIIQNTTPMSYILFLQALLFYLITTITLSKKEKNNLLFIIITLLISISFYSSNLFYLLIAAIIVSIIHPKVRLFFKKINIKTKIFASICFTIIIAPLIYNFIKEPDLIKSFLSITQNTLRDSSVVHQLFNFYEGKAIFNIGLLFIIIIGLYSAMRKIHAIHNLSTITILIINLLVGIFIINDLTSILILPSLLLTLFGINWIIKYWIDLFPFNPYAKFISSVFLLLITAILSISSAQILFLNNKYNPEIALNYNQDINILLNSKYKNKTLIVGDKTELNFYKFTKTKVKLYNKKMKNTENIVFTKKAFEKSHKLTPKAVLVNSKTDNFIRFYIY